VAIYPGYKGTRLPDPEPLPRQFDTLREVLDALGMEQTEAEGWEADDAIGALAVRAGEEDRIDIVTGDRDLIQLVRDPVVRVLFTVKGVSDLRVYDEAEALAKYGVPASRYAEFAMLRGDPSDGLPGVRGVGEKTARALINAYPSIDALLADALSEHRTGAILQRSPRLRASIGEAADYLRAMQEIVPVRTEVVVRRWKPDPDPEAVDRMAERYRITGPVKRLREALPALGPGRSAPPPPPRAPRRPGR
jgi:5'-3' exonuclease